MIYKRAHYKPIKRKSWLRIHMTRSLKIKQYRRRSLQKVEICTTCYSAFIKTDSSVCSSCIRIRA